jgi:ferric enterobactin receptor
MQLAHHFSIHRHLSGLWLILSCCLVAIPAHGQDTRVLKGYVRDISSGESLPYANVVVQGTHAGSGTNVDGYFVILNAPAAACTLHVTYIGYIPTSVAIPAGLSKDALLQITMEPSTMESDEVLITAQTEIMQVSTEPSQLTVAVQELAALPSLGEVDIFRSLQLLPGISGANDGSSGLYVRGGTPDQNLVMLDGMTIYHVDHFYGFFSAFNADAIKDVQIYKGGYPAKFGGRVSSVVDLTGKTGNINRVRVGIGANLLSGNSVVEIPLWGKGAFLFSARRSYTDFMQSGLYDKLYGFITQDEQSGVRNNTPQQPQRGGGGGGFGGGGGQRPGGGGFGGGRRPGQGGILGNQNVAAATSEPVFYFYDINSKLTLTPTDHDVLTFSIYNGRDNLDNSQGLGGITIRQAGETDPLNLSINSITEWGNAGMSAKWSRQWSDRFHSAISVARSNYFSDFLRTSTFDQTDVGDATVPQRFLNQASGTIEDNTVKDVTLRFDNEFHLSSSHLITTGVSMSDFNADFLSVRDDTLTLVDRNMDARQSAFYLQDSWKIQSYAELTLGVRGTWYGPTSEFYTAPRAAMRLNLTDRFALKGAWGHYNQFINRITNDDVLNGSRDFWLLSDQEMQPGSAEHYIAGLSYETESYLFDVETYYKDLSGLLEYSRRVTRLSTDDDNRFFDGAGVAKGLEVLLQKKRGTVTGWIGYTLGKVQYSFPELNSGNSFAANHDRRHELKNVGMYSRGNWSFTATWVLASGQPYTSPESEYSIEMLDGTTRSYIHVGAKNSYRLPMYHRLDVSLSRKFRWDGGHFLDVGFSVFNLYNRKNIWYREFQVDVSPIVVRDVPMLGMTPTAYFRVNF